MPRPVTIKKISKKRSDTRRGSDHTKHGDGKHGSGHGDRRIKRKSSIKQTWEKFESQSDSRTLLKNAWKVDKDKIKEYTDKINKLHKKYSS